MDVHIIFKDSEPKLSVYGLEGVLLRLAGVNEYLVSKDPEWDTLSISLDFFIEENTTGGWELNYSANIMVEDLAGKQALNNLLHKANLALTQEQPVDLTLEFSALCKQLEPYNFCGLFESMTPGHQPMIKDWNEARVLDRMREKIKSAIPPEQIENDEVLKYWLYKIPHIVFIDDTKGKE
jgi:hypothetical protein